MPWPSGKIILIIGACNKDHRMCSYVTLTSNLAELQIIDVTKEFKNLENFDESYFQYIDEKLSFFGPNIGEINAVICYDMDSNFKNAFIEKLNPRCLIINFLKAKMTETELFEQITLFNKKLIMESKYYKNNLLLLNSAQDPHAMFRQLPKELLYSIAGFYSDLQATDNASFRFFKALSFPKGIPDDNEKNHKEFLIF